MPAWRPRHVPHFIVPQNLYAADDRARGQIVCHGRVEAGATGAPQARQCQQYGRVVGASVQGSAEGTVAERKRRVRWQPGSGVLAAKAIQERVRAPAAVRLQILALQQGEMRRLRVGSGKRTCATSRWGPGTRERRQGFWRAALPERAQGLATTQPLRRGARARGPAGPAPSHGISHTAHVITCHNMCAPNTHVPRTVWEN